MTSRTLKLKLWPRWIATLRYKSIWNAEQAPIYLRKLLKTVKSKYLRTGKDAMVLEQFRKVFEEEVVYTIAYTATKSRKEQLRPAQQNEIEPEHFKLFMKYVDEKRDECIEHFHKVRDEYDLAHYVFLLGTTGILVGGFNGRGPDETRGCLLADYQNAKSPNQESEWFKMLTKDQKQQKMKCKRIDMQEKKTKDDVAITQELESFAGQSKTSGEMTTKSEEAAASLEFSSQGPVESIPEADSIPFPDADSSKEYEPAPKNMKKGIVKIRSIENFGVKVNVRTRWSPEEKAAFQMASQSQISSSINASA
ncbi:hypothetical protein QAD02_000038 [Eretmocerus hayati]|uniref:Uncharacterized protein n=1 Tax=Eretmocerus hayati TaxID=131215 RepID=A0ACC2NEM1_9HYME|nr:hypothetical protein QAD02_000038 [Eretmocerus hayati]